MSTEGEGIPRNDTGASIEGYLILVQASGPVLVQLAPPEELWMMIFSSEKALQRFCAGFPCEYERVHHITDGKLFLDIIRQNGYRLGLDCYRSAEGAIHLTEILLPVDENLPAKLLPFRWVVPEGSS